MFAEDTVLKQQPLIWMSDLATSQKPTCSGLDVQHVPAAAMLQIHFFGSALLPTVLYPSPAAHTCMLPALDPSSLTQAVKLLCF